MDSRRPRSESTASGGEEGRAKAKRSRKVGPACLTCRQKKTKCNGEHPCSTCVSSSGPDSCNYAPTSKQANAEYVERLEDRLRELSAAVALLPRIESSNTGIDGGSSLGLGTLTAVSAQAPPFLSPTRPSAHLPPVRTVLQQPTSTQSALHFNRSNHAPSASNHSPGSVATHSTEDRAAEPSPASAALPNSSTRMLLDYVDIATHNLSSHDSAITTTALHAEANRMPMTFKNENNDEQSLPLPVIREREEAYDLPHRRLADKLVTRFYERIHRVYCIIHWPTFQRRYAETFESSEVMPKEWLALLNQIFAVACLIGDDHAANSTAAEEGTRFYLRSATFMHTLIHTSASIEVLQCLLIMAQYLQSISQPRMCWNTTGQALRLAQSQGLHLPVTYIGTDPVQAETRRRVWAGCVTLEAKAATALGYAPSLLPSECAQVRPSPQPDEAPAIHVFLASFDLYVHQINILRTLYSSSTISTASWPDMLSIVTLDRELESWERTLPPSLHLNGPPAEIDEAGAVIMRIRLLNARLLLHRPMLFHLCQRSLSLPLIGAAPSPLDRKLAHASSLQCVEAAVELINRVVNEPNRSSIGAWWYLLFYCNSASLVLLCALLVDMVAVAQGLPTAINITDVAHALRLTQDFFSDVAKPGSIVPKLPHKSAKATALSCHTVIKRIAHVIVRHAEARGQQDYSLALISHLDLPPEASQANLDATTKALGSFDSTTEDLFQAFFNLLPDLGDDAATAGLPPPQGTDWTSSATAPHTYIEQSSNFATSDGLSLPFDTGSMSSWTMRDLLVANCLPSQSLGTFQPKMATSQQTAPPTSGLSGLDPFNSFFDTQSMFGQAFAS